jgi:hypothetical protein
LDFHVPRARSLDDYLKTFGAFRALVYIAGAVS